MVDLGGKLDEILTKIARQDVALFARDADNEFGTPGVMTVMQKVDRHIETLCSLARGAKKLLKFVFWIVTGAGGAVAAAKAAGWL